MVMKRDYQRVSVLDCVQLVIIVMKDQYLLLRMNVVIQLFIVLLDHHILNLLSKMNAHYHLLPILLDHLLVIQLMNTFATTDRIYLFSLYYF